MTTVHLVYPHGPRIACPDAIGRKLAERLRARYAVRLYEWDEPRAIRPGPDDILLGHPHPAPWTCFRMSMGRPGWRKVIVLAPYHHGDLEQVAFLDPIVARADRFLAITGNYWAATLARSPFAHWLPKLTHLDLAVDREDFPPAKAAFAPPGRRRFVYIGHSGWTKNTPYLSAIAARMPEAEIAWIGAGRAPIPGLRPLGFQDFRREEARSLVAGYDFMITVGRADANPTTVLEAMAWGLIPVCTPQSGYIGYEGIVNLPLDRPEAAVARLRWLQMLPDATLRRLQRANWELLDAHFTWDRFAAQVVAAIEEPARPAAGRAPLARRARLRWASLTSPYSPLRPGGLRAGLAGPLRRARRALRGRGLWPARAR